MVVRINLHEKRTLLGNKLDEEITPRGVTLWGRDVLLKILTINPAGDSVGKLCWGFQ